MRLVWICRKRVSDGEPRSELNLLATGKTRCEYLPKKEDEGAMLDARDTVLVCPVCYFTLPC